MSSVYYHRHKIIRLLLKVVRDFWTPKHDLIKRRKRNEAKEEEHAIVQMSKLLRFLLQNLSRPHARRNLL